MRLLTTLLCAFLWTQTLSAFMPNPDLLTITPPVARAGSTVEVSVNGDNLDELTTLRFEDSRIKVEPVMNPANELQPKPQPVGDRFKVTIPESVEPGIYEVRTLGYFGLSTARPFMVVPKDAAEIIKEGTHDSRETALPIDQETGVFGVLSDRKIDWYKVSARKGERLLIQVWGERLDSRADCQLAIYDVAGKELESNRLHLRLDPLVDFTPQADGVYYVAVSDTLYRGRKAEYFYRLRISQDPLLEYAFPPAIEPGKSAQLTVFGRNLPKGSPAEGVSLKGKLLDSLDVEVSAPKEVEVVPGIHPGTPRQGMVPGFSYQLPKSNSLRVGFSSAPVVVENPEAEIQGVPLPCEVAGRFDQPGDSDQFRFKAKKGETYWVEVVSERMDADTDPVVIVEQVKKDEAGNETLKKVVELDDPPTFYAADALDDLNADTLDPQGSIEIAEDGEYQVTLLNQTASGGPAHLYRLAIRKALPDFQLICGTERTKIINNDAYPAAPLVRRGGAMVYRIIALRRDGFDGEIKVEASGLPEGVTAEPLILSGKSEQGFLTIQAADDAKSWSGPIQITGKATIGETEVSRVAKNGSIIWGNRVFAYQRQVRSRLDSEVVLSVMDQEVEPTKLALAEDKVWTVAMNGELKFPVQLVDNGKRTGNLQVEVHGFPGLKRNPPKVTIGEKDKKGELVMSFKPSSSFEVEPGKYQFVLQGIGNAKYEQNPAAAAQTQAEVERLQKLSAGFAAEIKKQQGEVSRLEKELAAIQKEADAAADDAARAPIQEQVDSTKSELDKAKQTISDLEGKVKEADRLIGRAEKAAKAAAVTAKEKTNQFATYSMPITVEVTPAE